MTFIYVIPLHEEENGYGVIQNGGLAPDHLPAKDSNTNSVDNTNNDKKTVGKAAKFLSSAKDKLLCRSCKNTNIAEINSASTKNLEDEIQNDKGCFNCLKKKKPVEHPIRISVEDEDSQGKKSCWDRLKCCGNKKIAENQQGCLPFMKKKSAWEERRDSILSERFPRQTRSTKCKNFMKKLFCLHLCTKKKKFEDLSVSRRASTLSKKKSLTPTAVPVEDQTPKLDLSLVEHTSHMKAAIPVLPISLAWFCLGMNCILPGTGTVLSGMFCLCFGKPRFSQKDSIRSRIGAFIIDCIVGFSQCFTILFCLVGWGWSIWWGVIMVKLARKYKKLNLLADANEQPVKRASVINRNTQFKDTERGT